MTTTPLRPRHRLDHLDLLESHAIFILREVAAECSRPVLLFSGGKDSAVLLHLAVKAFAPQRVPFPVLHVDTGQNFPEVLAYRDEDKARAKERVLSFRDTFGQWDPRRQRPELWQLYQGRVNPGEHLRAFPLSDWTELDVWQYIERERMSLPAIYFSHERDVVRRDGMWLAVGPFVQPRAHETVERRRVRFRTVGDANCTGAVDSDAASLADIIHEVSVANVSERGATRADDRFSETAMEDRKREGYF